MPKLLNIIRDDSFIKFRHEVEATSERTIANDPENPGKPKSHTVTNTEEHQVTCYEAPLPSFDRCLQALSDVVANVLETGQGWKKAVTIRSLSFSYTKSGIRSVSISFQKKLDAIDAFHPLKTPVFQFDDGKTSEEGRKQCSGAHAKQIIKMIEEAEKYIKGERSQQMLSFEETAEELDADNTDDLDLGESDDDGGTKKAKRVAGKKETKD